ncbi:morphogenic membrane protein MmpB [Streptacidiphilus sp. EB129]
MLWADPRDDTARERRRLAAHLRRVGLLIAFLAVLLIALAWI